MFGISNDDEELPRHRLVRLSVIHSSSSSFSSRSLHHHHRRRIKRIVFIGYWQPFTKLITSVNPMSTDKIDIRLNFSRKRREKESIRCGKMQSDFSRSLIVARIHRATSMSGRRKKTSKKNFLFFRNTIKDKNWQKRIQVVLFFFSLDEMLLFCSCSKGLSTPTARVMVEEENWSEVFFSRLVRDVVWWFAVLRSFFSLDSLARLTTAKKNEKKKESFRRWIESFKQVCLFS